MYSSITADDIRPAMRGLRNPSRAHQYSVSTADGGNGNGNSPPIKNTPTPFYGSDTMLGELRARLSTFTMLINSIKRRAEDEGWTEALTTELNLVRRKMVDVQACIWLLETRSNLHSF